jgi:hypothetical protein
MKRLLFFTIAIIFIVLSCKINDDNYSVKDESKLIRLLKDSTYLFNNLKDIEIKGEIENENFFTNFHSISETDFFDAFNRNRNKIRFFARNIKINEPIDYIGVQRNDSVLLFENDSKRISFIDLKEDTIHRARFYFLDEKIGSYWILKKIQFEDEETLLVNSISGEISYSFPTINIFCDRNDSLLLISDSRKIDLGMNEATINILKLSNSEIDTLITSTTSWWTNFAFFDIQDKAYYFILNRNDNNQVISVYSKLSLELINKNKNRE